MKLLVVVMVGAYSGEISLIEGKPCQSTFLKLSPEGGPMRHRRQHICREREERGERNTWGEEWVVIMYSSGAEDVFQFFCVEEIPQEGRTL